MFFMFFIRKLMFLSSMLPAVTVDEVLYIHCVPLIYTCTTHCADLN